MDILVLSPTPTFPTDQGNRTRIASVCQYLKDSGARIHFLYFPREWGGRFIPKEYDGVAAQWDYFDVIPPSKEFVYMTDKPNFGIDDWWDESIAHHLKWKTNCYFYDAFIVNYAFFSKAFEYVPANTLKVLDTHDRLGDRRQMLARHGLPPDFFYTSIEEEQVALNRADVILAITQSEAMYFRTLTSRPVITIGHVSKKIPFVVRAMPKESVTFGFFGSDNIINVRNVQDFLTHFYQRYPSGLETVRFRIVGSCCNRLKEFADFPGVTLAGRVGTVDEFYGSVDCVFVPFMFGTGQKIKVVEALSYGMPLIATVSASDGVYSMAPSHNATNFSEVSEAILKFVHDVDYRRELKADTIKAFGDYCAGLEFSLRALCGAIQQSRSCILVDSEALYKALIGRTRAQIIEALVPLVPTLDALSEILQLSNKDHAIASLRLISQSLLQRKESALPFEVQFQKDDDTQKYSGVVVALGDTGTVSENPEGKVMLNILTDTYEVPHPELERFDGRLKVMLRNHWTRESQEMDAQIKRMAPIPYDRKFKSCNGVLFLARQFDDPSVMAAIAEVQAFLGTIYRLGVPMSLVDADGTLVKYSPSGETTIHDGSIDFYEILLRSRAEALQNNNIAVNVLLTYGELPSLLKILANDCGPLVSLGPPNRRIVGIDGEIMTTSARETAIRIAALAAAPCLSGQLAERWRLSVSSMVSSWLFKESLSKELVAIRNRRLFEARSVASQRVEVVPE